MSYLFFEAADWESRQVEQEPTLQEPLFSVSIRGVCLVFHWFVCKAKRGCCCDEKSKFCLWNLWGIICIVVVGTGHVGGFAGTERKTAAAKSAKTIRVKIDAAVLSYHSIELLSGMCHATAVEAALAATDAQTAS